MGLKRYLLRNDAIYGFTSYRSSLNYNISQDRSLVTNSLIWTVEKLRFILSR